MTPNFRLLLALALALALAGSLSACGSKDQTAEQTAVATETTAAETTPAAETTAPPDAQPAATAAAFDINSVPVSTASLGAFPYLNKLPGYKLNTSSDSIAFEFDRYYVYDGKQLLPIEGRVLRREYIAADEKKRTSDLMIQRNYENLIKSLGGVLVNSGSIPNEALEKVGREEFRKHNVSPSSSDQVNTYVIRQKDKEIWVQVKTDDYHIDLDVVEKAAMPQQATVTSAAELKKN